VMGREIKRKRESNRGSGSGRAKSSRAAKPNGDRNELIPMNHVELVGRVSAAPIERELPSGDKVVEFRLVIARQPSRSGRSQATEASKLKHSRIVEGGSVVSEVSKSSRRDVAVKVIAPRREVDTLDVAVWGLRLRKKALGMRTDDWVQITGAVRRRFWQAPHGLASRWQVEAYEIALIRRAKTSE